MMCDKPSDDKQQREALSEFEGWYRILTPWRSTSDPSLWPPAPKEPPPPRE